MSYFEGRQIVDFRPSGDHDWARQSACATEGIAPMFPAEGDEVGIDYAKAICNGCPVREDCLGEAMDRNEPFGIWGGLTADERRMQRRQELRAAAS